MAEINTKELVRAARNMRSVATEVPKHIPHEIRKIEGLLEGGASFAAAPTLLEAWRERSVRHGFRKTVPTALDDLTTLARDGVQRTDG